MLNEKLKWFLTSININYHYRNILQSNLMVRTKLRNPWTIIVITDAQAYDSVNYLELE